MLESDWPPAVTVSVACVGPTVVPPKTWKLSAYDASGTTESKCQSSVEAVRGVGDRRVARSGAAALVLGQRGRAGNIVEAGREVDLDVGRRRARSLDREVRRHRHRRPGRVEDGQDVRRERLPLHVRVAEEQPDEIAEVDEVLVGAVRAEDGREQLRDRDAVQEVTGVEVAEGRARPIAPAACAWASVPVVQSKSRRRAVEERAPDSSSADRGRRGCRSRRQA